MNNKTYINGVYFKEIEGKYGNLQLLDININELEKLKKHANEKGYIKLKITKRKEVDKFGNTHFITLNDYKKEDKKPNNYDSDMMPF